MENEERQQYENLFAKLSEAKRRKCHQYLLAHRKKQKQVARNAQYVFSRSLRMRVNVNQEWGHHFILLETLFDYPEEAWGDPVAMREHRKNPVWRLARITIEMKLRPLKFSRALIRLLTDFAFPAAWDELAEKMERKERPQLNWQIKQSNSQLRHLAAQEKLAQRSGDAESLRLVESQWPRIVKEHWAGLCLYGKRLSPEPLYYARPGTNRKQGRPHRPLLVAFRRASLTELTKRGFSKAQSSFVIADIEIALKISKSFTAEHDQYGNPGRIGTILKSQ